MWIEYKSPIETMNEDWIAKDIYEEMWMGWEERLEVVVVVEWSWWGLQIERSLRNKRKCMNSYKDIVETRLGLQG